MKTCNSNLPLFLRHARGFGAALVLSCCGAGLAMAGGGGENLLLVVNPNDPASLQIANTYAALRDIPANNILFIAPPAGYRNNGQPISQTEVVNIYLAPISSAISARGLASQIDYIGTIGQATCYFITPEADASACNANSLCYALSLLTPLTSGSGLTMQNASYSYDTDTPVSALYRNPASISIGSNPAILHSASYSVLYGSANYTTQYYLAGAIGYTGTNGNTVSQVIASLQNSAASDGSRPAGAIFFEDNNGVRATARDQEWSATESQLTARGVSWVYENNVSGATPLNRGNVLGAACGSATVTLPNGSTYLPGSWADNLTSYGCDFPDTSQTKATAFVAAGAGGTTGSVVEPYVPDSYPPAPPRFTNSSIYTFIADGSTLGEAFARSVPAPDTQMPLGDMLAQPFADVPVVLITSGPGNYGKASGTVSLSGSAALMNPKIATGISRLESLMDGVVSGTSAGGNATFNINTGSLSDGVHEVRIVAVNNAQAASEGYASRQVVVNNHGRSINIAGGNLTLTASSGVLALSVAAGDGTVSQVELTCLGRVVAQAPGSSASLSLNPGVLAPGDNVIAPVALFEDGMQIEGGAFAVHVENGVVNYWNDSTGSRLWSNPANWTSGATPQTSNGVARFSGGTGGGMVTLDTSASVEEVALDSVNYTIAALAGQTLTLSTPDGAAAECMVNVLSGSQTISAPIALASPGNLINVTNAGDTLTLSGNIGGMGSLTKTGVGTLILSGSGTWSGVTNVNAGTLILGTGGGLLFQVTNSGNGNSVQGSASVILNGTFAIDTSMVTNTTGTWNLVAAGASYGGTFNIPGFTGNGAGTFTRSVGNQLWSFSEATGNLTLANSQSIPAMPPWAILLLASLLAVTGAAASPGLSSRRNS